VAGNEGYGGGVACSDGSLPRLSGCKILKNFSFEWGGGLFSLGSTPLLSNCTIAWNVAIRGGGGVGCSKKGSVTLINCTIVGNASGYDTGGIGCLWDTSATLRNCIVWGNAGKLTPNMWQNPKITALYSCVESDEVWTGDGNINADPRFGGWERDEMHVDSSNPDQGDGSEDNPYQNLSLALADFSLALSDASPCLGTGQGGVHMGADTGRCQRPGEGVVLVNLKKGTYNIRGLSLAPVVSLVGADQGETILEGTVMGLRARSVFSRVTVTAGRFGGILIAEGESPRIEHCAITANAGRGIGCWIDSSPTVSDCTISRNCENIDSANPGGINCYNCFGEFSRCLISGNSGDHGGGIKVHQSDVLFRECTIIGNVASQGGGVYTSGSTSRSPHFVNTIIAANYAREEGGALYNRDQTERYLINCTLSANSAPVNPGVACEAGSLLILTNCIFWNDPSERICGQVRRCLYSRDPLFRHDGLFDFNRFATLDIEGTVCEVPDFVVEEPDFRLGVGSPALDGGLPEGLPDEDIEGNPRVCGEAVDIGAYESCEPMMHLALVEAVPGVLGVFASIDRACVGFSFGLRKDQVEAALAFRHITGGSAVEEPDFFSVTFAEEGAALRLGCILSLDEPLRSFGPGTDLELVRIDLCGTASGGSIVFASDVTERGSPIVMGDTEGIKWTPTTQDLSLTAGSRPCFVRGDVNEDSAFDIVDPLNVLLHLFGTRALPCMKAADANDDGMISLSDAIFMLAWQFQGGGDIPSPFWDRQRAHENADHECGPDPTRDELDCESYSPCQ